MRCIVHPNKESYKTRTSAWFHALKFMKKFGNKLGIYKCKGCGKFHLTSRGDGIASKEAIKQFNKKSPPSVQV